MEHKTVYYLSGLPRSGGTLLTCLLNQNPKVFATPQTDNAELLRSLLQIIVGRESFSLGSLSDEYDSLLSNYLNAFYGSRTEPVIIDRNLMWGVPYQMNVHLVYRKDPLRILFPYRPLVEVVASYVRLAKANPDNWIDREMSGADFFSFGRKSLDDARVDWLLRPGGQIDTALLAAKQAFDSDYKDYFFAFPYSRLVQEPSTVLSEIYSFLELDTFEHDFAAIPEHKQESDSTYFGVPDLHRVAPTLQFSTTDPTQILTAYGLERCASEDFWTPATELC